MASVVASELRIAIALSGGVDSAVTALLLRRCVHTEADVAALRCFGSARAPPPALNVLQAAVAAETSLVNVLPHSVKREISASAHECSHQQKLKVVHHPFYMHSWYDHEAPHGWCVRSQRDYDDAQSVAHALDLLPRTTALPILDLAEAYADRCFQRMLHAYAAGHTLNVDVLCNSCIKFGAAAQMLKVVRAPSLPSMGSAMCERPPPTLLATGHYARTWGIDGSCGSTQQQYPAALLLQPCSAGHDLNDQTHFLSRVPPSILAGALFPLGHLFRSKADVRTLARYAFSPYGDIANIAQKKTSTGICFVGASLSSSFSTGGNSRKPTSEGTTKTCAAPPSCKQPFASFLNTFLPPPSSPLLSTSPPRTIFREATTNIEKELADGARAFSYLQDDYPSYLPAYAVTLGQRLRLVNAHDDTERHARNYYVAGKRCLPARSCSTSNEVRLLAEVLVVDRWDHPLLFAARVHVVALRWWVPTAALRRASGSSDESQCALACCCALRHQMTPQPATVRWTRESEEEKGEDGLYVRSCTVCFETPVRTPTAGQAVVVYASLSDVVKLLSLSATPASLPSSPSAMTVIGSGWVAATTTEEEA